MQPAHGLLSWFRDNCSPKDKDTALHVEQAGRLAGPIFLALDNTSHKGKISPDSLKNMLSDQFQGKRTIPQSTIVGLAILCGVDAAALRASLADKTGKTPLPTRNPKGTDANKTGIEKGDDTIGGKQINSAGTSMQVLSEIIEAYYGQGNWEFGIYSVKIDGQLRKTTVFVRPSEIGLTLNVRNLVCRLLTRAEMPASLNHKKVTDYAVKVKKCLKEKAIKLENKPLYRLVQIGPKPFAATFSVIDFFDYRFGPGLLEDELIGQAGIPLLGFAQLATGLPLRSHLLPNILSLVDFQNRICAGGIGVLFALNRGDDYFIPLQIRSNAVSDGRNSLAVVPKGFHQHTMSEADEVHLKWTLFRELFEELYEGDKDENQDKHYVHNWYVRECPQVQWFFEHADWRAEVVCFGINAVSGNYDFGILLTVEDPAYYETFFSKIKGNWETERALAISSLDRNGIADMIKNWNWASESLVHFVEALQRLKKLHPAKVSSPKNRPTRRWASTGLI